MDSEKFTAVLPDIILNRTGRVVATIRGGDLVTNWYGVQIMTELEFYECTLFAGFDLDGSIIEHVNTLKALEAKGDGCKPRYSTEPDHSQSACAGTDERRDPQPTGATGGAEDSRLPAEHGRQD